MSRDAKALPARIICASGKSAFARKLAVNSALAAAKAFCCVPGNTEAGMPVNDRVTDTPRALVAGIKGDCGKALKNRAIPLQAFADRLLVAPQPFRPSLDLD